jgi:hypothetical protein
MTTQMISTGGGRGHATGCTCPFCLSGATTGEVLDIDLLAPASHKVAVPADMQADMVLDVAREHLAKGNFSFDFADRVALISPALAESGATRDFRFQREFLYPLTDAVHRGDDESAQALAQRIADLEVAERAYLDSDWRPGTTEVTDEFDYYGALYTGSRYDPQMSTTDVAKAMRADIKDAKAAGFIPADLNYRVVSNGDSVRVVVQGMADERAKWRNVGSPYAQPGRDFGVEMSWEANRLDDRLKEIGAAYVRSRSNAQADYANVSTNVFIEVESEFSAMWERHEAEKTRLKKAIKAADGDQHEIATLNEEAKEMLARHRHESAEKREFDREAWGW